MALSILNNISSMTAENALSNIQANLQKTLTQLSTGMKINSGSDDAAGLSIAQGLTANIAALTQSQQNASNGIGMLQTADGALSQTNTLLNRAVTLATEGATSGIRSSQSAALNTEYQSILSEINQIGSTSNFNGANVFGVSASVSFTGTATSVAGNTWLTGGSQVVITDTTPGKSLTVNAGTASTTNTGTANAQIMTAATATDLNAAITAAFGSSITGAVTGTGGAGAEQITSTGDPFTVASTDANVVGSRVSTTTAPLFTYTAKAGTGMSSATTLGPGTILVTDIAGSTLTVTTGSSYSTVSGSGHAFTANAATFGDLVSAIAAYSTDANELNLITGTAGATGFVIHSGGAYIQVSSTEATHFGATPAIAVPMASAASAATENVNSVYIGDGATAGAANTTINTSINSLSAETLKLNETDLSNSTDAAAALTAITSAITQASAQRGVIGASVNRLSAAGGDMSNEVTNLQSAANSIQNADIGKTVANMTQYNVLQSTGMAALQQSNQAQQAVLKLVQ